MRTAKVETGVNSEKALRFYEKEIRGRKYYTDKERAHDEEIGELERAGILYPDSFINGVVKWKVMKTLKRG